MGYIRIRELTELLGVSVTTINVLQTDENSGFPEPLRIGTGPKAQRRWEKSEVIEWIESRRGSANDSTQQQSGSAAA